MLATTTRWDLKDINTFPLWEEDFDRLVRRACGSKFLGSTKPTLDEIVGISTLSGHDTRSGRGNNLNLEDAHAAIKQWETLDENLFDMAMASVTMSEAELAYVRSHFKPTLAGNALVAWIKSKASRTSASGQMELKRKLTLLKIEATASSAEIEKVLDDVSTIWPKIMSKQSPTSMTESIEFALSKIPPQHPIHPLIDTIETNMSMGVQGVWTSYADFKERLMEQIKKKEIAMGGFGSGSTGAVLPVDGQEAWRNQRNKRKTPKEQKPTGCLKCPMFNCGPNACVVFGTTPLDQITGSVKQKRLVKALRAFVQKTRCTQILESDMKEKSSPVRKFIATFAAEEREKSKKTNESGLVLDGPSEVPEGDDNFWEMLANNQHNLVLEGVCMQPEARDQDDSADLFATDSDYETDLIDDSPLQEVADPMLRPSSPDDLRPATPPIKIFPVPAASTQLQPPPPTPKPLTPVRFPGFSEGAGISSQSRVSTPAANLERILEEKSLLHSSGATDSTQSAHATNMHNTLSEENATLKDELERLRTSARRNSLAAHAKVKSLQQLRTTAESALAAAEQMNRQLSNNVTSLTATITSMRSEPTCTGAPAPADEKKTSELLAKSRSELSIAKDRLAVIGQLTKQGVSAQPHKSIVVALTAVVAYTIARLRAPKLTATLTMLSTRLLRALADFAIAARAPAAALLSSIATILSAHLRMHAPVPTAATCITEPIEAGGAPGIEGTALTIGFGNQKAASAAILYDTGCSTLMTKDLEGAIGPVRKIDSATFTTAVGNASFNEVVRKRRTIWGQNGEFYTFEADWMLNRCLPYDVIGPGVLRKSANLIYVDADPNIPNSPPRLELRKPGKTLSMARTPNGLEWLSWHRPLDARAGAVSLVVLSEKKLDACTAQPMPPPASLPRTVDTSSASTDEGDDEFGPFMSAVLSDAADDKRPVLIRASDGIEWLCAPVPVPSRNHANDGLASGPSAAMPRPLKAGSPPPSGAGVPMPDGVGARTVVVCGADAPPVSHNQPHALPTSSRNHASDGLALGPSAALPRPSKAGSPPPSGAGVLMPDGVGARTVAVVGGTPKPGSHKCPCCCSAIVSACTNRTPTCHEIKCVNNGHSCWWRSGHCRCSPTYSPPSDSLVDTSDSVVLPLNSAGAGMGKLKDSLSDLEKVILTHCRLGHASLRRLSDSSHHTIGGMRLTKEAIQEFAKRGCDVCNAYKIKLVQPKEKNQKTSLTKHTLSPPSYESETKEESVVVITVDEFGKVSIASAGDGYHYAVLFVWAEKHIGWLFGAKIIDAGTIASIWKRFEAKFTSWFPGTKIKIVRMDSLATHRSAEMLKALEEGMVNPQFSPPGQHAMLQAAERYFYIMVVRALIMMRHSGAPIHSWHPHGVFD